MIASPLYHQKASGEKRPHTLFKYVTQRSLAVVMFVALAVLASIGNKPSDKRNPGLSNTICQPGDQQSYLALNPRQLFGNIVRSVKDAFNDPALIEYAKEQGIDGCDSLTTPCSNASQKTETFHSSLNN
jgi:hypothetical protein